jgi:hypothetical protein
MFTAGFDKALHWINFDLSTGGFLSLDATAVAFELSPFFSLLAGRAAWLLVATCFHKIIP